MPVLRWGQLNNALISGAAKAQARVGLGFDEGAVDQDVDVFKDGLLRFV